MRIHYASVTFDKITLTVCAWSERRAMEKLWDSFPHWASNYTREDLKEDATQWMRETMFGGVTPPIKKVTT
jgi:hypothetical protein